jgi:hypothetical protein
VQRAAVLLAFSAILAGCSQSPAPEAPSSPAAAPTDPGVLHGLVLDDAIRPIAGATVTALGTNATVLSGEDGSFLFPDDLPREQPLVILANAPRYRSASVQASLPATGGVAVRIVLALESTATVYQDVVKFDGLIGCQTSVAVSEEEPRFADCDAGVGESTTAWVFSASPALVAAVVEVTWEATQPLAEGLGATLSDPKGEGTVLTEAVGRSPLRLVLAQAAAERSYASGGDLRLEVYARPVTDEDEQAVAATVAVQQSFQAFATLFYGAPPDPTYSFVDP